LAGIVSVQLTFILLVLRLASQRVTAECRQPEFGAEVILVWTFQPRLLRPLHAPAQAAHICGALSILAAKHFLAEMIGGSDVESSAPPNRQLSLLGKRPKDLRF